MYKKMMLLCAASLVLAAGCKSEVDNKPAAKVVEEKKAPEAKKEVKKEAPKKEEAKKEAPKKAELLTLTVEPGEFKISPSSKIGFVGAKVVGDHSGGFPKFEGKLKPKGDSLESVEFIVDMNAVTSDDPKLTEHLKNADFFDVPNFPQSSFVSTKIEAKKSGKSTHEVTGKMTLRGVTKTIAFPATITVKDGKVVASTEFTLKRFDFGIKYPGRADNLIKDEVLMKINLEADTTKK